MTTVQQDFIIDVFDRPKGSTIAPVRLGWLKAVSEVKYRRAIDGNEWCTLIVPAVNLPSWLRQKHIIRVNIIGDVTVSGSIEEFRIDRIIRSGQLVQIECRGFGDDLTTCGPIYKDDGNGRVYEFTDTMTVLQWLQFIRSFHIERGFQYWDIGTVTPTDTVTLEIARDTPRQILETLAKGGADIGLWEYYMAYDPTTGRYNLSFVEEYNSSADTLRVLSGSNLQYIEDESRVEDFMSGIAPVGVNSNSIAGRTASQTQWKVTAVGTSPDKITLADPQGVASVKAIKFDDQFNDIGLTTVVQVIRTGRRYTITDTVAATQELYLSSVDQIVVGDYVELFYEPAGTTLTRFYYRPVGVNGTSGRKVCAFKVGTVTGASLRFQALDPGTATVGTMIFGRNTNMNGLIGVRSTVVVTPVATAFNSANNQLTVASTASINVGDWGQCYIAAGWRYETFRVKSIVSGTVLEIEQKYPFMTGVAFTISASLSSTNAIILREQSNVYYVTKHTGYQNFGSDPQQNIWLDNVTGVTAGDYFEFYVEIGGVSVNELYSPQGLRYPDVSSDFERYARDVSFKRFGGEPQLFPHLEPFFDSATDGFGGNTWGASVTASVFNKHGPNMLQNNTAITVDVGQASTADDTKGYRWSRLLRNPFVGDGRLVVAAWMMISAGTAPWSFELRLIDVSGNYLARKVITDTDGITIGNAFMLSFVVDPTSNGFSETLVGGSLPMGLRLGINASSCTYRIDAFTAYWAPDGLEKFDDTISERGGGPALWSKGLDYLEQYHMPPRSLQCNVIDLWRLDRTRYSGKRIILGGPASVYNEQTLTDLSARITSVETIFSPRVTSKVSIDVNTQQQTLAQRLAE